MQIYDDVLIFEIKEVYILFNDTLNTLYLRLFGVGHMVEDHMKRKYVAATSRVTVFN